MNFFDFLRYFFKIFRYCFCKRDVLLCVFYFSLPPVRAFCRKYLHARSEPVFKQVRRNFSRGFFIRIGYQNNNNRHNYADFAGSYRHVPDLHEPQNVLLVN